MVESIETAKTPESGNGAGKEVKSEAKAEALFAPNKPEMKAHRKHNTPKQGHLLSRLQPT